MNDLINVVNPWMSQEFDERQINEIKFCRLYKAQFNHGTDGHNAKLIIARMADMLDAIHYRLVSLEKNELIAEVEKVMGHDDAKE